MNSLRITRRGLVVSAILAFTLVLASGGPATPIATPAQAQTSPAVLPGQPPANTATVGLHRGSAGTAPVANKTAVQPPGRPSAVTFTGTRAETETFIRYYKTIHLTPQQERVKIQALSALRAPCCSENPLSTCCCPCNMAKAAWGLSAWLITEKGYGVEQVREAARSWLAASNPHGFTGNACHAGGCARPIHQDGCGGMDDSQVL